MVPPSSSRAIEFDVDFRYDLTDPRFQATSLGDGDYKVVLPPTQHEVLIRDMRIHSEGKTDFLPWLMPDLLGRFFTGGFSVEAKNKLIAETREEAKRFAGALVRKATSEAQSSATRTLDMLGRSFGGHCLRKYWSVMPAMKSRAISGGVVLYL